MSDVFISYSRKNSLFARRLIDRLNRVNKESWVDWEGIPLSSPNWWLEIKTGIENADSFIFVMSPDSMASVVCNLELDYALELQKRIIPVVYQEVESREAFATIADFEPDEAMRERLGAKDALIIARDNWHRLSHINWLFFLKDNDFDSAFERLIATVETDLDYVKSHTRYLTRAQEWERTGKPDDLLLFGDEIDRAELWLHDAEKYVAAADQQSGKVDVVNPLPRDVQRNYIAASRQQARRRSRVARGVLVSIIGLIMALLILGFIAFLVTDRVQRQLDVAYTTGTEIAVEATVFSLRQERISTLSAGGAVIAVENLEPVRNEFVATATTTTDLLAWEPRIETFDGVEMVLVPAGCFWMGSIFFEYEQPIHEICFDRPFWIDRYEVTNEQFNQFGGIASEAATWPLPQHPRTAITWVEARDFCILRGSRLPTEAEWEYASRGPNSLTYPWGNEFEPDYLVYADNSNGMAAVVGSKPDGASWVGALDMSGNVWEWTSTIFDQDNYPYPYSAEDGREDVERTDVSRVIRGSSMFGGYFQYGRIEQVFLGLDLRGAWRLEGIVDFGGGDDGFRCVRTDGT